MASIAALQFYVHTAPTLVITMSPVVDITGWHATFTMRAGFGGVQLIQAPAVVNNGPAGIWYIPLTAQQTALEPQTGVFDLYRTDPGSEDELTIGTAQALPGVTLPVS